MAVASKKLTEAECLELIEAIATEALPQRKYKYELKNSEIGTAIQALSRAEQAQLVITIKRWYAVQSNVKKSRSFFRFRSSIVTAGANGVFEAASQLLRRKLPFSEEEVIEILSAIESGHACWQWSGSHLLQVSKNHLKQNPLTPELKDSILRAANKLHRRGNYERKYSAQLKLLIAETDIFSNPLLPGEAWSDQATQDLETISERTAWQSLLLHCSSASAGKPSGKWVKTANTYLKDIGTTVFIRRMLSWFPLVDQPRTQPLSDWRGGGDFITDQNADILKGLVWLCADQTDPALTRAISALAISAYRKIPGIGARCVKLGNACIWTLGQMPCEEAVAQLALLKAKVKFGSAQIGIEKALTAAAERLGISRSEIEELSIPTYGLTTVGIRRETFATESGDYTAELKITGTSTTALTWLKPDGKPQKSVPKAVKDNYADELKAIKQSAKDIQKMLPAQRDRIDNLFLAQKTWDYETWRDRYLNHPLIGSLARRIIWQFSSAGESGNHSAGIWIEGEESGAICDRQLIPITWLEDSAPDAQTTVQLWHPITASSEAIQQWRDLLLDQQIQQPFKQAHRELYLLTAAEETTGTYSNRFAAHILKQHQFNALAKQRGWKNQLRLMVDDSYEPAQRILENWGLRAEFWIEGIGDDYGTDTTEAGTYLHLSTDQVRFYPTGASANRAHAGGGGYNRYRNSPADKPLALTQIPALVFSEILRDVDLFVGVASVGNDPGWADGGTEGHRHEYWQSYSFGDLSATAQTRRQVLETLVPRLKIKDRCSFREKFLVVRGDLRTYKIHLGSGNILMEPNDQYLCIVPGRSQTGPGSKVFLPFEGDRVMAIILSKAFLLAADTKIKDETILQQIR